MAKNASFRVFSRFVKIKPDELKISFYLFFYLFLVIAAYNVVKPIRNASFLAELGYKQLPLVYLLTAGFIGFVVALHSRLQEKFSRYNLINASLLFFLVSCIVFRILSGFGWKGLPVIFWVWANVFIIVLNTQFWIMVNDILNPREFKRLSGFFISGGILGGFIGGMLAGILARENVDYNLLFISAGMLALCSLFVYLIYRWQKKESTVETKTKQREKDRSETTSRPGFRDCFNTVKNHNYLRFIATIVVLTLIVSTLIDFQFQTIVQNSEKTGNLTSFFGFFNAGLMVFAFLLSILMTSKLYENYGVRISLLLYPLVLFLCFLGIGIAASLVMAIIIKGSDKSLSYSINRSARELLYIPISPDIKYKAIIFIDMFVDRFSKGIGAVVLLIIMSFSFQDHRVLVKIVSLVSVVLILGWIVFTLRASKEYRGWIIKNLLPSEPRPDKSVEAGLDKDYVKLIIDTLESKDRSPTLYAMNLFELIQKGKLTPELMQLLSEEPEITAPKSLGAFFESDPTALLQMNEVREDEFALQIEIKEIMALDAYEDVMMAYCEKILAVKNSDAETARMEIAKAIGFMSADSPMVDKLEELITDDSSEVRRLAIESMSKFRRKEHVPALIQSLEDVRTQSDSSTALEKYGSKISGILADYLGDTDENIQLRKAVAPILAHIGNQEAADFILWELEDDNREIDTELIDALDRIRSETASIKFSVQTVKKKIRMEIMSYYDLFVEYVEAESKGQEPKICGIMSHQLNVFMMNIFKLLGLIYPHEEIVKAFQNIQAGTKKSVAYAVEALDNTLEKEMREAVLPIVEDLSLDEKVKACLALRKDFPEI